MMFLFQLFFACQTDSTTENLLTEGSFQLLSYNIHGLPPAITEDNTAARIEQISYLLDGYDFVGLQEDWDIDNYDVLIENTHYPFTDRFDEKLNSEKYYGSGLSSFTVLEPIEIKHTHYTECSGYLDGASDCFASKGFQFFSFPLNSEHAIHIYNTHLEAGGGEEDNVARESQITQLVEAFDSWSADTPLIFMGDTNLHSSDEADIPLLTRLEEAGLQDICSLVACPEPDHIDRIFIRSSSAITLSTISWSREEQFVDDEGTALSDHPAISGTIKWSIQ